MVQTESPDSTQVEDTEIENEFDHPGLKEIVGAELKALAMEGMRLNALVESAKTQPKKRLYIKKIKKNSAKAAELILYLERVQITDQIKLAKEQQEFIDIRDNDNDNAEGRASEEGSGTQD